MQQPYYDARASRRGDFTPRRRLLLFSYHFAPDGAVGGLRWERHAAHLGELGWDVDVVARDLAALSFLDESRLASLANNLAVYAVPEQEPLIARVGRAALGLRRRLAPAPRQSGPSGTLVKASDLRWNSRRGVVRAHAVLVHIAKQTKWANSAAALGSVLAKANSYDVIASSGPPHMAHEAARLVAARSGAPLLIDLRDPWGGWKRVPEDFASPLWFSHAERFEQRAVRSARLVVMNTDPARDDIVSRYPLAADRVITIRNGSDDDPIPVEPKSSQFRIRFAGTIYLDRDPRLVLRAAGRVVRHLGLAPNDFRFEFMGEVGEFDGQSLLSIAADEGLDGFVSLQGHRPKSAATQFLAGATMVLSLPQDADLCIPAKVFEYTRFNAWVLILTTAHSATARLFAGSGADVVEPGDVDRMADVIAARYQEFRCGVHPAPVGADGRFERRHQVEILAAQLEAISPGRHAAPVVARGFTAR